MNAYTQNTPDPRKDAEWQRQEAARSAPAEADPIYRAIDRAARQPLPSPLPADLLAGIEKSLQRPNADDRFEIGLLGLVLSLGGLMSLLFLLPTLGAVLGELELQLPESASTEISWGLMALSALAAAALLSGALQRLGHRLG